jgi:bacteriorhodopsin
MIYISGVISLIVQVLTGVIDFLALNIDVIAKDQLIKDLLQVELFVQVIELIFYIWFIYYLHGASKNITPFRYLDWAITTPTMLITLSAFLNHNGNTANRLTDFLYTHTASIIKIVLLNALMLVCGLLGEFGYLSHYTSTALGFIPFSLNFKNIKDTFLPSSDDFFKNAVFYWFVFFWSLYGVFAVMSYTVKNTGYNILDVFAKNFFGIFLAYVVWAKSKAKNDISLDGKQ